MCSACSGDYQYDDTDDLEVSLANPLATRPLATAGIAAAPMAPAELAEIRERAPYAIADEAAAMAYLRWERERMSAEGR